MKKPIKQMLIIMLAIVSLTLIMVGCNGAGISNPFSQLTQDEIEVTVDVGEPIQVNQPVVVTITVVTKEDIPDLKVSLSTSIPGIELVDGLNFWVVDSVAQQPMVFTSTIKFTRERGLTVIAFAQDPSIARIVDGYVSLEITGEEVVFNPTYSGTAAEIGVPMVLISGTLTIATPTPTPSPPPNPHTQVSIGNLNLPIPDNNQWVTLPLSITNVSANAIVSSISIKFLIDHPHGEELTVELVDPNHSTTTQLWHRETISSNNLYEGLFYVNQLNLSSFNGIPVAGKWQLRVRDEIAGNSGTINGVTLHIRYTLSTTTPIQPIEKPEPHTPPPFPENIPTPEGSESIPNSLPNASSSPLVSAQKDLEIQGEWVTIATQDFEDIFPSNGWTIMDLSNDGYDRLWDDDDYRYYNGWRAAWPANGGSDGILPEVGNDHYFNNMDTMMVYGPIDLSDAVKARVSFNLWLDVEATYDKLSLAISADNNTFEEIYWWDGVSDWQPQLNYFNRFTGDDSVWVAWRFFSDEIGIRDGPWIDDIVIEKKYAGYVTAKGYFYYYDRESNLQPAAHTPVYLYDSDPSDIDDYLGVVMTDDNGYWEVGPVKNQDDPGSITLDIYPKWALNTTKRTVTDYAGFVYTWQNAPQIDVEDGILDFGDSYVLNGTHYERAMWIFQDMYRAWTFPAPYDPGPATVRWEKDKTDLFPCYNNSCYWPYSSVNGIFITDQQELSPDIVVHEIAHAYMDNEMDNEWFWEQGEWADMIDCIQHTAFEKKTELCAWMEGWADFYAFAVNGDPCYDFDNQVCGPGSVDMENHTWGDGQSEGDQVEARVAGALWDIYDNNADGFDQYSYGFDELWDVFTAWEAVGNQQQYTRFKDFWLEGWFDQGHDRHYAISSIYQNSIDYNYAPIIYVPNYSLPSNVPRKNAISLRDHAKDTESETWQLTYTLTDISDTRCGVSINAQDYVDIQPDKDWFGGCVITVKATDVLSKSGSWAFQVIVWDVESVVYLPLIIKNPN